MQEAVQYGVWGAIQVKTMHAHLILSNLAVRLSTLLSGTVQLTV